MWRWYSLPSFDIAAIRLSTTALSGLRPVVARRPTPSIRLNQPLQDGHHVEGGEWPQLCLDRCTLLKPDWKYREVDAQWVEFVNEANTQEEDH